MEKWETISMRQQKSCGQDHIDQKWESVSSVFFRTSDRIECSEASLTQFVVDKGLSLMSEKHENMKFEAEVQE